MHFKNSVIVAHSVATAHGWQVDPITKSISRDVAHGAGTTPVTLYFSEQLSVDGTKEFTVTGSYFSEGRNILSNLKGSTPCNSRYHRAANLVAHAMNEALAVIAKSYGGKLTTKSSNVNCLEDFRCPACGHESSFTIETEDVSRSLVTDGGVERSTPISGTNWEIYSACSCSACGMEGEVGDFTGAVIPTFTEIELTVLDVYNDGDHQVTTPDSIEHCGDLLLRLLLSECGFNDGEPEARAQLVTRFNTIINEVNAVHDRISWM